MHREGDKTKDREYTKENIENKYWRYTAPIQHSTQLYYYSTNTTLDSTILIFNPKTTKFIKHCNRQMHHCS